MREKNGIIHEPASTLALKKLSWGFGLLIMGTTILLSFDFFSSSSGSEETNFSSSFSLKDSSPFSTKEKIIQF